ncbi:MAG: ATP-binding protein [Armatimonadetes bacterium]|nr:ATP-binding protein [Armatimonadota bacterium]
MASLPVMNMGHTGYMVVQTNSMGLSTARKHVHGIARGLRFSDDDAADILLAVGEAISNAYRHGTQDHINGFIYIDWEFAQRTLTVSVKDEGSALPSGIQYSLGSSFTPTGCGLDIIRKSVDDVFLECGSGTRIALRKRARELLR